ncbi:MAG: hypothetical protein AAFU77_17965 [Myxococcota bacterium]
MQLAVEDHPTLPDGAPDPETVAHEFMGLLRDLKDDPRPELARTRIALLQALDDFSQCTSKELAELELWAKLRAVESVVARLTLSRVKKLAKRFNAGAKRVSKSSTEGRAVHEIATSLRDLYMALNALKNASQSRDEEARARAHQMLVDAQQNMSRVQARYGEI